MKENGGFYLDEKSVGILLIILIKWIYLFIFWLIK